LTILGAGKPGIVGEAVLASPRSAILIQTAGKGTPAGGHYHSTADEIAFVIGGAGKY